MGKTAGAADVDAVAVAVAVYAGAHDVAGCNLREKETYCSWYTVAAYPDMSGRLETSSGHVHSADRTRRPEGRAVALGVRVPLGSCWAVGASLGFAKLAVDAAIVLMPRIEASPAVLEQTGDKECLHGATVPRPWILLGRMAVPEKARTQSGILFGGTPTEKCAGTTVVP